MWHLRIRDSVIQDNYTTGRGGAIHNDDAHLLVITLDNVWIDGNTAYEDGGAIFTRGDLEVINSTLSNNVAVNGKGGAIDRRSDVAITGSTISGNTAGGAGGALHLSDFVGRVTA